MKKYLIGVVLLGLIYYYFNFIRPQSAQEKIKLKPKNVVIIMADDIGYNDVSYHGSDEFATYNIDALAYNGVILDRFYTTPLCTPSRASLMTGKYHHHVGMQHHVIFHDSPFGLGLDQKLMPQYFKEAGYKTHLVGKWHLGHYQPQYWPNSRGFDSFFGYIGTYIDYFDHTVEMLYRNYSRGHDLRRNFEDVREYAGQYATDVLTKEAVKVIKEHDKESPLLLVVTPLAIHSADEANPLQPKVEDMKKFPYIESEDRRKLAAMLYSLDQGIGEIISALTTSGLMEDTIIAFMSDNGGPTLLHEVHATGASNYPLRGEKGFAWEGGIRVPGFIYAPFLPSGVVRRKMFHVCDFIPTLATLANADYKIYKKLDGMDLANMVKTGDGPYRTEIETYEEIYGISGIILNGYKLINGTAFGGQVDGWLGTNDNPKVHGPKYYNNVLKSKTGKLMKKFHSDFKVEKMKKIRESVKLKCSGKRNQCDPGSAPCLFDIENDPCEENNLARTHKEKLNEMKDELNIRAKLITPSRFIESDPRADPKFHDLTWNWWENDNDDHLKNEL